MARPKKISMQTIADDLKISKNAVSLALSGKKGVSEQVRNEVKQRAKDLGYSMQGKTQRGSSNILVLVPERVMSYEDNEHFHFYHDMLWGLEAAIRKEGYNAVIAKIDIEMERKGLLPGIFDIDHAGVILFGIMDKNYARKVWELKSPLVMIDSYYRDLPCAVAASSNLEGAHAAVSYLFELGHKRIGFMGPSNLTTSHEDRWFGYWKAMADQGIYPNLDDCLVYSDGYRSTREEISAFLDRHQGSMPTAFFCSNDRIALILNELLRERNYSVPSEVSIIGFDDITLSAAAAPSLTTMRVAKKAMTEAAVELLLSEAGSKRERIYYGVLPGLTIRESTSTPKQS
ncbi:transcriptional regulator [Paenibacillus yonginensis]|uniref:Transcriptional regulator n=1 Tax=Paenibacillus yonginensis TaxID=1462996 RepID=A0A1B1N0V6_9BACL|nr:LacI family DNA-binding transcriptional regulator [Paenibacillus yonginensis]ANS75052.1 transcriptional regulator [Paenibacillus yonginensis]